MINLRHPRVWTALFVSALATVTVLRAAPLAEFGVASAMGDESAAASRLASLVDDELVGALSRAWLFEKIEPRNSARRVEEIRALLSRAPLSSGLWLDLARARFTNNESADRIFAALAMSQTTGPNEARVMAGRAAFALPLWRLAPIAIRRTIARDLAGGWVELNESRRTLLRALLSEAQADTRTELRSQLLAQGADGEAIVSRLGLGG